MKYEGLNIMKKRFLAALLCLCLLVGLVPGMGTTAFAPSDHNIGDTVTFAGYDWYIIGTKSEGVTAPEGYYTLFAKNNDFGSTAFRREPAMRTVQRITTRTATCKKRWRKSQTDFPPRTKPTSLPVTRWTTLRVIPPSASFCGPSAKRKGKDWK